MAELVDAPHSKCGDFGRKSSSLFSPTPKKSILLSKEIHVRIENGKSHGSVPEWLMGADCKSAGLRLRWFKSNPAHICLCGSVVEHTLGKGEVTSSILVTGSLLKYC